MKHGVFTCNICRRHLFGKSLSPRNRLLQHGFGAQSGSSSARLRVPFRHVRVFDKKEHIVTGKTSDEMDAHLQSAVDTRCRRTVRRGLASRWSTCRPCGEQTTPRRRAPAVIPASPSAPSNRHHHCRHSSDFASPTPTSS